VFILDFFIYVLRSVGIALQSPLSDKLSPEDFFIYVVRSMEIALQSPLFDINDLKIFFLFTSYVEWK